MKKSKYFEKEDLRDLSILLLVCIISFSILVGILGDSENDSIIELFTPDSKDSNQILKTQKIILHSRGSRNSQKLHSLFHYSCHGIREGQSSPF